MVRTNTACRVRAVFRNIHLREMIVRQTPFSTTCSTRTGPQDIPRLKKWKGTYEFNSLKSNTRRIAIFLKDVIAPKNIEINNVIPGNLSYLTFTVFEKNYLIVALYDQIVMIRSFTTNISAHDYTF